MNFRRRPPQRPPLTINGAAVEGLNGTRTLQRIVSPASKLIGGPLLSIGEILHTPALAKDPSALLRITPPQPPACRKMVLKPLSWLYNTVRQLYIYSNVTIVNVH